MNQDAALGSFATKGRVIDNFNSLFNSGLKSIEALATTAAGGSFPSVLISKKTLEGYDWRVVSVAPGILGDGNATPVGFVYSTQQYSIAGTVGHVAQTLEINGKQLHLFGSNQHVESIGSQVARLGAAVNFENNTWLSIVTAPAIFEMPLRDQSWELACFLALSGCPPVFATGAVFNSQRWEVDHLAAKARLANDYGQPLYVLSVEVPQTMSPSRSINNFGQTVVDTSRSNNLISCASITAILYSQMVSVIITNLTAGVESKLNPVVLPTGEAATQSLSASVSNAFTTWANNRKDVTDQELNKMREDGAAERDQLLNLAQQNSPMAIADWFTSKFNSLDPALFTQAHTKDAFLKAIRPTIDSIANTPTGPSMMHSITGATVGLFNAWLSKLKKRILRASGPPPQAFVPKTRSVQVVPNILQGNPLNFLNGIRRLRQGGNEAPPVHDQPAPDFEQ